LVFCLHDPTDGPDGVHQVAHVGLRVEPLLSFGTRSSAVQSERAVTEVSGRNGLSLTGLWNGLFSYPRRYDPTSFVAILIESGTRFSGTTHEPCTIRQIPSGVLYATLQGERAGAVVAFMKTYDGTGGWTHSVAYDGLLSSDGTEIEGRWRVSGAWSGKFLMVRSGAEEKSVVRKAFEPVGRS
jgi:hypothetical protein